MDRTDLNKEQKVNPELIYAYSRTVHELWRTHDMDKIGQSDGESIINVMPSFFSKRTRTFHWMNVSKEFWNDEKAIDGIAKEMRFLMWPKLQENEEWCSFRKNVSYNASLQVISALNFIEKEKWDSLDADVLKQNEAKYEQLRYSLLSLFSTFHHPTRVLTDGILYRVLEKHHSKDLGVNKPVRYLCTKLQKVAGDEYPAFAYPKIFVDNDSHSKRKYDVVDCLRGRISQTTGTKIESRRRLPQNEKRSGADIAEQIRKGIRHWDQEAEFKWAILIPVYDVWVGGRGWGNIWGNIALLFKDPKGNYHKKFLAKHVALLINETRTLSEELFDAALALALSMRVEPPYDLVEHFVRLLVIIQDWDAVKVIRKQGREEITLYCYHRVDTSEISKWQACTYWKNNGSCNPSKYDSCINRCGGQSSKRYFEWGGEEMWNDRHLPEISNEEVQTFGDIYLRFYYPKATAIPNDTDDRELLESTYRRQQLALLRELIQKVRGRRAALRNAAVSIMGRNMSHNIGSHVLARLQVASAGGRGDISNTDIENIIRNSAKHGSGQQQWTQINEEFSEEAGRLVRFLQQRMDFIAEASTTQPFFSMPMNLFGDVLKEFGDQKLLLEHISGIGALKAAIKIWTGEQGAIDLNTNKLKELKQVDVRFSCSSGRTGMHALYVLIENIIRNSAKHGSGQQQWTQIKEEFSEADRNVIYTISIPPCVCPKAVLLRDKDKNVVAVEVEVCVGKTKIERRRDFKPREDSMSLPELAEAINSKQGKESTEARITLKYKKNPDRREGLSLSLSGQKPGTIEIRLGVRDETRDNKRNKYLDRYHEILIWDLQRNGTSNDKDKLNTADRINQIVNESHLVEQDGSLNQEAWGIREMQIACAYLRGIALEDLEAPRVGEPPILEACLVDDEGREDQECSHNLAYRFFLKKAQDLLIVADGQNDLCSFVSRLANIECVQRDKLLHEKRFGQEYCLWLPSDRASEMEASKLPVRLFNPGKVLDYIREEIESGSDLAELLARKWSERLTDKHNKGEHCEIVYTENNKLPIIDNWYSREELEKNILQKKPNHQIVFDSHGYILKLGEGGHADDWVKTNLTKRLSLLGKLGFYEPTRSSYPQTPMLREQNENKAKTYNALFKAAAISRVLILDERIQVAVERPWEPTPGSPDCPLIDVLRLGRVFVPPKEKCDLDKTTLSPEEIDAWLEQFDSLDRLNVKFKRFDFIVIHQGIVDKLRKGEQQNGGTADWIIKLLDNRSYSGRLVICSGRGAPRDLPENARFLPLSNLLHTVTLQPSKFHLMHLLWASRAPVAH